MSFINRYESCIGITLYKFGSKRAELWIIPRNYTIIEHQHSNENIELMFLFGRTTFYRRPVYDNQEVKVPAESLTTRWRFFGRCFSVKYYHSHWFKTTNWPLVFINFQTFLLGKKPVSAAEDFKITN